MRRRLFLGFLAAFAAAPISAPAPRLRFEADPATRGMSVSGDPVEVIKFAHLYQDNLWPGWRGSKEVCRMYDRFERHVKQSGTAVMYTGCRLTQDAFNQALKASRAVKTFA